MPLIWRYELTCDVCGRTHNGGYYQPAGSAPMMVTRTDGLAGAEYIELSDNEAQWNWYEARHLGILCAACAKGYAKAGKQFLCSVIGAKEQNSPGITP